MTSASKYEPDVDLAPVGDHFAMAAPHVDPAYVALLENDRRLHVNSRALTAVVASLASDQAVREAQRASLGAFNNESGFRTHGSDASAILRGPAGAIIRKATEIGTPEIDDIRNKLLAARRTPGAYALGMKPKFGGGAPGLN